MTHALLLALTWALLIHHAIVALRSARGFPRAKADPGAARPCWWLAAVELATVVALAALARRLA